MAGPSLLYSAKLKIKKLKKPYSGFKQMKGKTNAKKNKKPTTKNGN